MRRPVTRAVSRQCFFSKLTWHLDRPTKSRALAFLKRLTSRRGHNTTKQRTDTPGPTSLSPTKHRYSNDSNNKENEEDRSPAPYSGSTAAERVSNRSFERDNDNQQGESYRSAGQSNGARHASHSDADGQSKAGTSGTVGMSTASNGGNSIFSSPNQSSRSLTTTLTTIQSQAPSVMFNGPTSTTPNQSYPQAPASAVPAYLTSRPSSHVPTTYRGATANNLLSDNASVLTLASSSHRPNRRDSWDEDASIRAIPPRSAWGGSRESLPLSVLSQNPEQLPTPAGQILQPSQRYSTSTVGAGTGIGAPVLSSERNSVYAGKASTVDGASIRSGHIGHGRSDSTAGSVLGNALPVTKEQERDGQSF